MKNIIGLLVIKTTIISNIFMKLLIRNRMVSRAIWIKQALMNFSKTSNTTRPSDSCNFDAL
jgi:hypothetical protein